jgi:replicative DNA helicase
MTRTQQAPDLRVVDEAELRTLPHDLAAEQAALGGMLLAPHVVDEVAALLGAGDFYRPAHQIIFEAITRIHGQGAPADAVTLAAELTRTGELERCGSAMYLHTLTAAVPTAANAAYYAGIVAGNAKMRRLVEVGTRLAQRGYHGDPEQADELLTQAHEDLILDEDNHDDVPALDTALDDLFGWLETDPAEDPTRIPAPYADLDRLLDGLHPGQMVTIGARPAIGKSVVALDLARHAALRAGAPVYFASLEMRRRELLMRLTSAEARIPLDAVRGRRMSDAQWIKAAEVRNAVAEAPHLLIDDNPNATVDTIRAGLRRMARRADIGPARLVVIDYLQLLSSRSAENRQVQVSELSRRLKLLAREFDIPVVVLAQLNRGSEQRTDKRPAVSDLRESGAIEQDSDVVILLHREDAYDKESPRSGEMELIVGKNRNGPTGIAQAAFQGHYSRAVDMAADPGPR